jgi:hypothetical protein
MADRYSADYEQSLVNDRSRSSLWLTAARPGRPHRQRHHTIRQLVNMFNHLGSAALLRNKQQQQQQQLRKVVLLHCAFG